MATEYTKKYPKEVQDLLKRLVDNFHQDDYTVRQTQIRTWRRLKMLWENYQSTYYNDVAHDWRIPTAVIAEQNNDQDYYDKPINVFRAYLESIIAALSVTIPGIKCYPDDANNILDINTAKAGDKIAQLIYRHNDVSLLWLHALFTYCTEGMVAGFNQTKCSAEYGTYKDKQYKSRNESRIVSICPNCGAEMDDSPSPTPGMGMESNPIPEMPQSPEMPPEMAPNMGPEMGMGGMGEPEEYCESCGSLVTPLTEQREIEINELISQEDKNKSRQCIDAFGGLYVKVPNWARKQCDCPYLIYSYETHFTNALDYYPHLRGEIDTGVFDPYEVWGRLSPQYRNEYPRDQVTCRHAWFRPSAYNILKDEEMKVLNRHFPDGVRVDLVNECYAGAEPEKMDDCWTLTYNPMSSYVHADPIGLLLVSVQEITNDLISLTLQTVEHGIGQTFADPAVLDFRGYKQLESAPGQIFPAKAKAGKSVADGFYEIKTATLSGEVMPFGQEIQNMGQLVSGALPSLFGGAMAEQKTASGYAMSRAQALQRLQNTWKMFTIWWKTIFAKAIPQYIENVQEDEHDVEMTSEGGFINSWIRLSELSGKIGKFELEANENLPQTWSQRKDTIMQLMQLKDPQVMAALWSPENRPLLKEAIGLDDFFLPGEDYRDYYIEKIRELLEAQPVSMPMGMDPMGQPTEQEMPSNFMDIDPDFENPTVGFEMIRNWMLSEDAKLAKMENPDGYRNVLLFGKQLLMMQQQAMMAQMAMQNPEQGSQGKGAAPTKKPKETDKTAPIEGEQDVQTI